MAQAQALLSSPPPLLTGPVRPLHPHTFLLPHPRPAMADALYSSATPSSSSHKRSYADIAPDLDSDQPSPSGSQSSSSRGPSSSSASGNDRTKRARSDNRSTYAHEVEDILLPADTSFSSSASNSSLSSYHSARSTFSSSSPSIRPVAESPGDDIAPFDSFDRDPLPEPPAPTALPFVPQAPPIPSPSPPPISHQASHNGDVEFRMSMERAGAFDREMAALRHSPQADLRPFATRPQSWGPRAQSSTAGPYPSYYLSLHPRAHHFSLPLVLKIPLPTMVKP